MTIFNKNVGLPLLVAIFLVVLQTTVGNAENTFSPVSFGTQATAPVSHGDVYFLGKQRTEEFIIEGGSLRKRTKDARQNSWMIIDRGGAFGLSKLIPAGYNPFGYQITDLGKTFLEFDGSLDSDIGRFLASVRTRKRFEAIKQQWLEILRVSKKGQSMRIYRKLESLVAFCLKAGLLD